MCGIVAFYARESVPDFRILDMLFENSENRGTDGFGIWIGRKNQYGFYKSVEKYTTVRNEALQYVQKNLKVGQLLLAISRAAPETEARTTEINMQPIMNCGCVMIHNGSVTFTVVKEIAKTKFPFTTNIDSEAIIAAYILHNKNMKDAMEYISGGVASVFYDTELDRLYIINDFKPIAHCYIRGVGYFVSSDNDALGEAIRMITGVSRDGMNMWEDWYHHYLIGNYIRSFDLDSCFMREQKYSPRYIVGNIWDTNYNQDGSKKEIAL